jgi:hypothetical protein
MQGVERIGAAVTTPGELKLLRLSELQWIRHSGEQQQGLGASDPANRAMSRLSWPLPVRRSLASLAHA